MPIYGNPVPDPWNIEVFCIFLFHKKDHTSTIPTSPQPLLRVVFNPSYPIFSIFCPICPYMEIRSQTPGILKFFEFSYFIRSALLVRFQRALDHFSELFLTEVILSFLYLAPYAHIWKFGPRPLEF